MRVVMQRFIRELNNRQRARMEQYMPQRERGRERDTHADSEQTTQSLECVQRLRNPCHLLRQ